ncbi:MAG: UDP-2,3-diacylglucosamine diphosphatase [Proteobacteria bacterium]|nr:UDP-2,3-diacylglucosamine diphosphatase [Pseudomonadota bacterium]
MSTLFISDLHLSGERPEINVLFLKFLANEARQADALYILGDLFEYWIGDEAMAHPDHAPIVAALRALTDAGVPLYIMVGNRDFLIGEGFAAATGCQLIDDPTVINLYSKPVLLMHGDTLCTDDHDYQKLRLMLRNPDWRKAFLAKSVEERIEMAQHIREQSKEAIAGKQAQIMDVNQDAVETVMREHGAATLIHGHTHRPDTHTFTSNNKNMTRHVLADWYQSGSVLHCDAQQCNTLPLS